MARGDIQAGKAYVTTYVKNSLLVKGLREIQSKLKSLRSGVLAVSGGFSSIGQSMAGIGSMGMAAFGGLTAALAYPIKAAGDLMETTSKFEAVFGDSAGAVKQWADQYAAAVGRSKSETMTALSTFQAFFKGLGMGGDQATDFSKEMSALAVDFASFHNLQDPEAMQRFISALSGSGEVLSMFGVNIMQAALDQKLLQLGFKKSTQGATEMQKVMARMAIIKESMGKQGAVGDAIKTAGSFSNQMKALKATIQDTAEEIGGALLPVVTPLVGALKNIGIAIANVVKNNHEFVVSVAKITAGLAVGSALVAGLGMAMWAAGTAVAALLSPLGMVVAAIVGVSAAVGAGVYAWTQYTQTGKTVLGDFLKTAKSTFSGIGAALMKGDLQLAGQIAIKGLELAMLQGVQTIADGIGGQFGETFGTIGSKIIKGDFLGAFKTALKQMLAWGASFAEGIVAIFTVAARAATDAWESSVTKISQGLLEASAQGGVAGKIASYIIGNDMQAIEAERKRLDAQLAAKGLATGPSAIDEAKASARQQVAGMADSFRATLDKIDVAMQDLTAGANADLAADTAGSSTRNKDQIARLTAELAALRKQAEAAKAAVSAPETSGAASGLAGAAAGAAKLSNFASFSASAFLAGAGTGPTERIAKAVEMTARQQKEALAKMDKQQRTLDRLAIGGIGVTA